MLMSYLSPLFLFLQFSLLFATMVSKKIKNKLFFLLMVCTFICIILPWKMLSVHRCVQKAHIHTTSIFQSVVSFSQSSASATNAASRVTDFELDGWRCTAAKTLKGRWEFCCCFFFGQERLKKEIFDCHTQVREKG